MSTKVEIFEFASESHDTYRYTSANQDVIHDGETWSAIAIERGGNKSTVDIDKKSTVKLTLPIDNPLVDLFERYPPGHDTVVTISEGIRPIDSSTLTGVEVITTGVLSSSGTQDESASFDVTPALKKANKVGPCGLFSATCRWALYGRGCGVDEAEFTTVAQTNVGSSDAATRTLRVRGFSPNVGEGYFAGGYIRPVISTPPIITADHIVILSQGAPFSDGANYQFDVVLGGWSEHLFTGLIEIVPGCDYSFDTCIDKFDNSDNFGGFHELSETTRTPYGTGHSD